MRLLTLLLCLVVLHINAAICYPSDDKVEQPNETGCTTFQKVKDGVRSFGSKVSGVAKKGYEELKNLISSDRKVGDYQLQNIDVRVRDEEDYEELPVKKRTKRETEKLDDIVSHHVLEELDEIMKDISVLQTTKSPKHSLVLENNAEIEPGLPRQFAIIRAPLICPDNQKPVKGNCRTIL